jgi:hypothetical protein
LPVRRSGAIAHGAAATSFTIRNTKAATMIHGITAHRNLAALETEVHAAGADSPNNLRMVYKLSERHMNSHVVKRTAQQMLRRLHERTIGPRVSRLAHRNR